MNGVVTVLIENTYSCGRESWAVWNVSAPPVLVGDADEREQLLRDWFTDEVHDLTGDGHPCGSREHALYEATITAGDRPELVGQTYSWEG